MKNDLLIESYEASRGGSNFNCNTTDRDIDKKAFKMFWFQKASL